MAAMLPNDQVVQEIQQKRQLAPPLDPHGIWTTCLLPVAELSRQLEDVA